MKKTRNGKGDAGSALRRQWLELKVLAEARTGTTVADLCSRLRDEGYEPSSRTVERDLTELQALFPLKRVGNRPQTWYFDRKAPRLLIPSLSAQEALSFVLVEERLGELLPGAIRDHLAEHFAAARKVLAAEDGKRIARWAERVVALPRAQPLVPARVSPQVRDSVYDALLRGQQLRICYRAREAKPREHLMSPLGLAVRETVTYLVAIVEGFEDPRLFALHRMSSAAVVEQPARWPEGFDMRAFAEREVGWPFSEQKIPLVLRVGKDVLLGFEETPLSTDQTIASDGRGGFLVKASVYDTRPLRSFLLGYGPLIEVLEPRELRRCFATAVRAMGRRYSARSKGR
jgi:predicted DNA-binding transcriptional regulator YafY